MRSTERLQYSRVLVKQSLAKGILQTGERLAPSLLRNTWSNMGIGSRLGLGALGAGGLYGGYRALKPNTHGVMGQIQQHTTNQNSDLNQIMGGFTGQH